MLIIDASESNDSKASEVGYCCSYTTEVRRHLIQIDVLVWK